MNTAPHTSDIVLTGMGVVSPFGLGLKPFQEGTEKGEGAISVAPFQTREWCKARSAATVPDFSLEDLTGNHKESGRTSPQLRFAWAAMHLGLLNANLNLEGDLLERTGLFVGLSRFFVDRLEHLLGKLLTNRLHEILPLRVDYSHPNGTAAHLTYLYKITGPSLTFCASCQSGIHALEAAMLYLKNNCIDVAVVLSSDVVTPFQFHTEAAAGILSSKADPGAAPCPFDRKADGAVAGEGAVALVLERAEDAWTRKTKACVKIISLETLIEPIPFPPVYDKHSKIMTRTIEKLLGKYDPSEIDFIHADARGIGMLDAAISLGIRAAFNRKADRIPITSIQGSIGHTGGTNGLFQMVSTALALSSSTIPTIRNLEEPAERCDLDYVRGNSRQANLEQALVLSFGWGGQYSAVQMRRE